MKLSIDPIRHRKGLRETVIGQRGLEDSIFNVIDCIDCITAQISQITLSQLLNSNICNEVINQLERCLDSTYL